MTEETPEESLQRDLFGNVIETPARGYKGIMRTSGGMKKISKKTRERDPNDHYPTPSNFVHMALLHLLPADFAHWRGPLRILDPGAGSGPWGAVARQLWPDAFIVGVELDKHHPPHPAYNEWYVGDLIIGNPPFKPAEAFVRHAATRLHPTGYILFLLPLSFLGSSGRHRGLFNVLAPSKTFVCANRPSFLGEGESATDANEYAVYRWTLRHANRMPAEIGGWWSMLESFDWKLLWTDYLRDHQKLEIQLTMKI
jgi:hypothetical protein